MSWKQKITTVFADKSVSREIRGQTWQFYPVCLSTVQKLQSTITALVDAGAVLFADHKDETGQSQEIIQSADGTITRTTVDAIQPKLAELRAAQRSEAVRQATNAFLSQNGHLAIGMLVADSLRNDFERPVKEADVQEFLNSIDIASLFEFVLGVLDANAKVFGPLGEQIRAAITAKVRAVAAQHASPAAPEAPEQTPSAI